MLFHPRLIPVPASLCSSIPQQLAKSYENYVARVNFYQAMKGFVQNVDTSFDDRNTQDIFIMGLDRSDEVFTSIKDERESSNFINKYSKG